MTQDSFGAGVFDESKSHPASPQEQPSASVPANQETPPNQGSFEVSSHEAGSEPQNDFFVQRERDREKAMLLRRTREDLSPAPAPESPEPERRPGNGGGGNGPRWQGGNQQADRARRGGNRPPFNGEFREVPRRSGPSNEGATGMAPPTHRENREGTDFRDRRIVSDRRDQGTPGAGGSTLVDQRVAILVDVQNMYHSARKLHGRNLSYSKLIQNTVKGRKLVRAIAYLLDREGVDQAGFLEHLSHSGFEVRRKDLIERADGSRKGDWDLGIAIDAITLAEKVDSIILVSGDGDFACLAQWLRHRGVKVEIAAFRESAAEALLGSADGFHPLGKDSLY